MHAFIDKWIYLFISYYSGAFIFIYINFNYQLSEIKS